MTATPAPPPSLEGRFPMARRMASGWWVFVLRGAVAILFGLLVTAIPGLGIASILGVLAAWMAIDGATTLYQAVKGPPERHGLWFWVDGVVSLLAAVAVLLAPMISAIALVYVTSFWSIASGVFRLILAFRLGSVLMGVFGAIAVFFGAWLLLNPLAGLMALIWIVGLQALFAGFVMIAFGWRLRRIHHDPHGPAMGRG
ncbi:HdeD family acid-resistance protein [Paracraurococcus ruber]|uniref:HdeD family acid-resistance protein n=1 Tax=Paracraurococcus ruber TaxID=77675 RepID=A0ABS1CQV8_9PROT|nr:DUF308 domain-containing protein [Paracraurococcus ruber]MBK1656820.1 hypothetical protein [Paracraurococcus ruber]TDG33934.1 hypothetical protein E2C05_01450 [Paracraurococcus ruber]